MRSARSIIAIAVVAVFAGFSYLMWGPEHLAVDQNNQSMLAAVGTSDDERSISSVLSDNEVDSSLRVSKREDLEEWLSTNEINPVVAQMERATRPLEPIGPAMDSLVRAANEGDNVAAMQLHHGLMHCRNVAESEAALETRINIMSETGEDYTGAVLGPQAHREARISQYREQFEYCRGIRPETADEYFDWLRLAAERGHTEAQEQMGRIPPPGHFDTESEDPAMQARVQEARDTMMFYLNEAADNGSVSAMNALARSYYDGVVVSRDIVQAYSYMLATVGALTVSNHATEPYFAFLEVIERQLREHELIAGQEAAVRLLTSERCCQF